MADLAKMSKKQLETYAREELGVELDRRHSKKQLLAKVQELSEDQEVEEEVVKVSSSTGSEKVSNIKEHIEKHSGVRRDCSAIWTLIKHESSIYKTEEEIKTLLKAKGYETLLGEIS